MRRISFLAGAMFAIAVAGLIGYLFLRTKPPKPAEAAALIVQIREVARLETLEVSLYKKISFEPEPPASSTLWADVLSWARFAVHPPRGKAIVFADVRLGFDLTRFDESTVSLHGERAEVVLPPLEATVDLKPAETEVIGSNLDSSQTSELFALARVAFQREALGDRRLRDRARASAQRSIRALLFSLGFREVAFPEALAASSGSG